METIIFKHTLALGDIVCMTASIRDLAVTYPGKYQIYVRTSCSTLWNYNPHIAGYLGVNNKLDAREIKLGYGRYINEANRSPLHFLTAFHRDMRRQLGLEVPVLKPKGDLYLSPEQKQQSPFNGRYWVVFAGGKLDYPVKIWNWRYCQQVVDDLAEYGIPCVQMGAVGGNHKHYSLKNVVDIRGKTNLRDFLWVIYHADGVLCPITGAMHVAAVFDKPCVVTAGGREHWWWEAYVNVAVDNFGPIASRKVKVPHRYLHTQDLLDCCQRRGCWKNKIHGGKTNPSTWCKYPEKDVSGQLIPRCHQMVTAEMARDAILWYYQTGILPKIDQKYTGMDHEDRFRSENLPYGQPKTDTLPLLPAAV